MSENGLNKYIKQRTHPPKGFFEAEAEGLKWLKTADGVRVVDVFGFTDDSLTIEKVSIASPTSAAAYSFGQQLAKTHNSIEVGAKFGETPTNYPYFGPLSDPVPMPNTPRDTWIDYFEERMISMIELGIRRREFDKNDLHQTSELIEGIRNGQIVLPPEFLDDAPAKVHGDLWSGNLLWTSDNGETQAILIDPAAHIGHREEDLAMLKLFGCSYFSQILDGYNSEHPLAEGFQSRFTLHNLYPIAGHAVFFGASYLSQYRSMLGSLC